MSAWRRIVALCTLKMVDDTKKTQQAQVDLGPVLPSGQNELHDGAYVLNPYGVTSNPPDGSDALVIFLNADRTLGVVVGVNYKDGRPTSLKAGEAALFNAVKKTILKMADDGTAQLNCGLAVDGPISSTKDIAAKGGVTAAKDMAATGKVTSGGAMEAGNGATGTFVSKEGRTVTVAKGIITKIV